MIETTLPRAPDRWATVPAPDPAPLLEQVATLRRENAVLYAENAALRAQSAALQERIVTWKPGSGRTPPIPRVPPRLIRPRPQRGRKHRPPAGNAAANRDTAGPAAAAYLSETRAQLLVIGPELGGLPA